MRHLAALGAASARSRRATAPTARDGRSTSTIPRTTSSSSRARRRLRRRARPRPYRRRRHLPLRDLKTLLARATPRARATALAGLAAPSARGARGRAHGAGRPAARAFLDEAVVPYEDGRGHAPHRRPPRRGGVRAGRAPHRRRLPRLAARRRDATPRRSRALAPGLTPEMAAAVSKLMRNQDLVLAARKCRVVTRFRNTHRPARAALGAPAAQPPDRRPARHRRLASSTACSTAAATR